MNDQHEDPAVEELLPPRSGDDQRRPSDQDLVVGRGRDLRVPTWLDTAVQYTWRGLVLLIGLAVAVMVMTRLYLVTLPVLVALILSTLCVPPARRLERSGLPSIVSATIVVVGGIGSLVALIVLLIPSFVTQIQELIPTVQQAIDQVLVWVEEGPLGFDSADLEELVAAGLESLQGAAGTIAARIGTVAVAIGQGVTALLLGVVLLFFFVKDGEQIVRWFGARVPTRHRDDVRAASARGWVALSGFVRGTAAVALLDAVGIGLGLLILDVPLVLPLSVLVFFGAFVPVIGALITGLLAVLVALADGGWTTALIVVAIVLVVQQIESNLLQPTIMRRAVALHPVVILGVLTSGAVLIGIVGAFLAVPVTAVVAAVGNELRLRSEARGAGHDIGPDPIGGPGVDPETVRARFPEDTRLRTAGRRRRDGTPHRRRRTRTKIDQDGHRTRETTGPPPEPPEE